MWLGTVGVAKCSGCRQVQWVWLSAVGVAKYSGCGWEHAVGVAGNMQWMWLTRLCCVGMKLERGVWEGNWMFLGMRPPTNVCVLSLSLVPRLWG